MNFFLARSPRTQNSRHPVFGLIYYNYERHGLTRFVAFTREPQSVAAGVENIHFVMLHFVVLSVAGDYILSIFHRRRRIRLLILLPHFSALSCSACSAAPEGTLSLVAVKVSPFTTIIFSSILVRWEHEHIFYGSHRTRLWLNFINWKDNRHTHNGIILSHS